MPELLVLCRGDKAAFLVVRTGPLTTRPGTRGHAYARVRIKLDGKDADGFDWFQRSPDMYQPIDPGAIAPILGAKRVEIEFQPLMMDNPVTAEFDVSRLSEKLSTHAECKLPNKEKPRMDPEEGLIRGRSR
jgi:hypothetical protein